MTKGKTFTGVLTFFLPIMLAHWFKKEKKSVVLFTDKYRSKLYKNQNVFVWLLFVSLDKQDKFKPSELKD